MGRLLTSRCLQLDSHRFTVSQPDSLCMVSHRPIPRANTSRFQFNHLLLSSIRLLTNTHSSSHSLRHYNKSNQWARMLSQHAL